MNPKACTDANVITRYDNNIASFGSFTNGAASLEWSGTKL